VSRPERITVAGVDPKGPMQAFFDQFAVDQAPPRRSGKLAHAEIRRRVQSPWKFSQ
jgi:hypothetical protein